MTQVDFHSHQKMRPSPSPTYLGIICLLFTAELQKPSNSSNLTLSCRIFNGAAGSVVKEKASLYWRLRQIELTLRLIKQTISLAHEKVSHVLGKLNRNARLTDQNNGRKKLWVDTCTELLCDYTLERSSAEDLIQDDLHVPVYPSPVCHSPVMYLL